MENDFRVIVRIKFLIVTTLAAVCNISWMSHLEGKVEPLQFPVKVVNKSFNLI